MLCHPSMLPGLLTAMLCLSSPLAAPAASKLPSGTPASAPAAPATQPLEGNPLRLTLQGTQILLPDGRPIRLRGFNLLWWVPPTADDVADIKALGANCARYMFGYIPRGRFDPHQLRFLKRQVRLFTSQGLWVIPNVYTFQSADRPDARNVWNDPELQQEFTDLWAYILEELKDEPYIAAWEPINEPHFVDREKLAPWYREVVARFHAKDPRTPVVVEGANYSGAEELLDYLKLDDPNVIYSFHSYHPHEYTHMRHAEDKPLWEYPGRWDNASLAKRMSIAVGFRERHKVPVFCGEWGVRTGAPGWQRWLKDVSSLLEENQIPWAHWAWALQRRWPVNDTFDCNKQKTEIYGLMTDIFKSATQGP
jgi:hypothetical protein